MTELPTDESLREYFWRFKSTAQSPNLYKNSYSKMQLICSPDGSLWTVLHEGRVIMQTPTDGFNYLFPISYREFIRHDALCN